MRLNAFDIEFADKTIEECDTFEQAEQKIAAYAEKTKMSDMQEADLADYILDGITDKFGEEVKELKPNPTCKDCKGTGRFDAWTGPLNPTVNVPCPCALKLKVLHTTVFRKGVQVAVVAAVKSMAEFSRLLDTPVGQIRAYTTETGNGYDMRAAMSKPHTVFWRPNDFRRQYAEKDWK